MKYCNVVGKMQTYKRNTELASNSKDQKNQNQNSYLLEIKYIINMVNQLYYNETIQLCQLFGKYFNETIQVCQI